jgi:hypothetical protein
LEVIVDALIVFTRSRRSFCLRSRYRSEATVSRLRVHFFSVPRSPKKLGVFA